jgi:hypothetical protein
MKPSLKHSGRVILLALALVVLTPGAALLRGQGVEERQSGAAMNGDQIRQLVRILNGAYANSLMHGGSKTKSDLEASDRILEESSIQFSARLLNALDSDDCGGDAQTGSECALDDRVLSLGDWTQMISYAAYRLENLSRSKSATAGDPAQAIIAARLQTMEHLYRMVFAVSKLYLDRAQSQAYLDAAQEQLSLARTQMEAERTLCACDPSGYNSRMAELSELAGQMNVMRQRLPQ